MRSMYLTDKQYIATLQRVRAAILAGREFHFVDSNAIGDKHTHCSWGLCGDAPEDWPDKETLMWPAAPPCRGKVTPKYRKDNQHCPFEEMSMRESLNGCFYRCLAIKPISKSMALKLYDEEIARQT